MAYTYFPGCCMHGFARHCQDSLKAVFGELGIGLEELKDWNCCGATTYISIDELQAMTLAARNLAMADRLGREVVAPCNACFMVLKKGRDYLVHYPNLREKIEPALKKVGLKFEGKVQVRHPLEILLRDVGVKGLREKVKKPLKGWKVAAYYGCLLSRPYGLESGVTLEAFDELVPALGAKLVDFELKDRCCGGSLTGTMEEVGGRLVHIILREAKRRGADAVLSVCPLCQLNLEAHQGEIARQYGEDVTIPIPYFTQLIGLALDLPVEKLGLEKLLVPLEPVIKAKREATALAAAA
jgi:heterodisulfide reductase subunit B